MEYKVILEKNNYALILRGNKLKEYAVVFGLNHKTKDWVTTCSYYGFKYNGVVFSDMSEAEALASALDIFRSKTEENYIPRARLEELLKKCTDALIEDDKQSALEFFNGYCAMETYEKEFLKIDELEE